MAEIGSRRKRAGGRKRPIAEIAISRYGREIRSNFLGLKNDLWLAKRFCSRAGLIIEARIMPRASFGMAHYSIVFPADFSRADAERLIRLVRETKVFALRRFRYGLIRGLWMRAGREMLWSRRLQNRNRSKPIVR